MPKKHLQAAGEVMSTADITRRTILTGLGAATATAVTIRKAESSGLPDAGGFPRGEEDPMNMILNHSQFTAASALMTLIEAHKAAYAALESALDKRDEAEERYIAGRKFRTVEIARTGHYQISSEGKFAKPWWEVQEEAREHFATEHKKDYFKLPFFLSRETVDVANRELRSKYRAAYRRLVKALYELKEEQEAFGYAQAAEAVDDALTAEKAAGKALLAYRCETFADVRAKAEYIKSNEALHELTAMDPDSFDAFLSSFLSVDA